MAPATNHFRILLYYRQPSDEPSGRQPLDNLTHTLFALTLARTPLGRAGRGTTAALLVASNAPDIDIVTTAGGGVSYLQWHRGPTHGLLGVAGLGVLTAGLVWLWQRFRDRGLVVLGVPSNDFGQQEPGSATEIKEFCAVNYSVDFPLTEKCRVIGTEAHPFYGWIAATLGEAGTPRWNFHKYLVGPDGQLAGAWPTQVAPTDNRITSEIERLLPAGGN